ncbi:hypothetical protein GCM10022280_21910 [Sphingomonas swuensis]|uniref:Uncharacterized protein n=1 Tax=Sphingomonas swuensis TaxID=977800 RepID=A0ABP7T4L0_9SPHN
MLVLNPVHVMRRTRKGVFWALVAGVAAFTVLALFMVADEGGWVAWACLLFFGGGGAVVTFMGLLPPKPYQPRRSLKGWRGTDSKIVLGYKLMIVVGLALSGAALLWGFNSGFNAGLAKGLLGGLGLAGYAYYGLIAKSAHGDVDAAAVGIAADLGAKGRNSIYLAYANYGADDPQERKGNMIFLVGADRVITCHHDGHDWRSTEQPFDRIHALGLRQTEQHESCIYLEFEDGTSTLITLDPALIMTTEPRTFIRSLLELIDHWALDGAATPAAASRRRVVTDMGSEGERKPELVGQAQGIAFATPIIEEISPSFSPTARRLEV